MAAPEKSVRALVVYCSLTGNTRKAAHTITEALESANISTVLREVGEADAEELYDYDLVLLGAPSITFLPAAPMIRFLQGKLAAHRDRGDIRPCAPQIPGKHAGVFVTYSGPHTGISEATTAGKYMAQFLEHIGFGVPVEWYIVGEYHGNVELSTKGRLGDLRGRPNQQDLDEVRGQVRALVTPLVSHAGGHEME